jgi:FkbM family methyltransferase
MKILIAGDSWGCGEWSFTGDEDDRIHITHKGLETYLKEGRHRVKNVSTAGGTFESILHRLKLEIKPFDATFVFVTDAFRETKPALAFKTDIFWSKELTPQYYKDLYQQKLREFVHNLSMLPPERGPIYLIGCLSKLTHQLNQGHVKVAIPSMLELIVPGSKQFDTYFLNYQCDLDFENSNKETIDYVFEQMEIWKEYQRHPILIDNQHPGRAGHQIVHRELMRLGIITDDVNIDNNYLLEEFKDISEGRVLIIGGNQGDNNPAWGLIQSGWKAVICEPDPFAFSLLIDRTSQYADNITVVNSAISSESSVAPFYLSIGRPAMSSMKKDWLAKQNYIPDEEKNQRSILTHALSVEQLLEHVGKDFDLVVIDAEDMDEEIIHAFDWSQLENCRMVCVEQVGTGISSLGDAGYKLVKRTETNHYYKN